MFTSRQQRLQEQIPKAENHIHIEGSIPWALALELAEKNHVALPVRSPRRRGPVVSGSDLAERAGWVYDL